MRSEKKENTVKGEGTRRRYFHGEKRKDYDVKEKKGAMESTRGANDKDPSKRGGAALYVPGEEEARRGKTCRREERPGDTSNKKKSSLYLD